MDVFRPVKLSVGEWADFLTDVYWQFMVNIFLKRDHLTVFKVASNAWYEVFLLIL